jgi:16S rRNA (cytosine1402-N4)-methyltransferase
MVSKKKESYHVSVMTDEVIEALEGLSLPIFVEGTIGAGGHALAILSAHPEIEKYIGLDRDERALDIARENLEPFSDKLILSHANFADLDEPLMQRGIEEVSGFFFDLGVSSMQLDEADRGFSFREDALLDMRMNRKEGLSALDLIRDSSESELETILREYGEVPFAKRAAKAIVFERKKTPIETTKQLATLIENLVGGRGKIHPATLVFQGIRIAVNRELESIKIGLEKALKFLAPGGLIGVISFHSLEDRIVKNMFRDASMPPRGQFGKKTGEPLFEVLTKKPMVPTATEIKKNSRSRSAKLRWIRKIEK